MERMTEQRPTPLVVLAVDITRSRSFGNLTNPSTIEFWLVLVATGWAAAGAAGPPCETRGSARHKSVGDGIRCPRPLRSVEEPWGH
eukprot:7675590-Pyramimonas_sp.AAC.1